MVRIRHSCGTSRNAGVERARVDDGPLDERGDFVEQRIGHDRGRIGRRAFEADDDPGAPRGERRNHLAFGFEGRRVGVGGSDRDVAARQEAMPAGDASRIEVERAHRDHVGAMQRDEPVRRADELDVVVVAAGRGVAHHLRDRQLGNCAVERVLQRGPQRHGERGLDVEHALHLPVVAALDALGWHQVELVESGLGPDRLLERLGRRPVGVIRHVDRQQRHGARRFGYRRADVR